MKLEGKLSVFRAPAEGWTILFYSINYPRSMGTFVLVWLEWTFLINSVHLCSLILCPRNWFAKSYVANHLEFARRVNIYLVVKIPRLEMYIYNIDPYGQPNSLKWHRLSWDFGHVFKAGSSIPHSCMCPILSQSQDLQFRFPLGLF